MNDFIIKLGQAAAHSYLEKVTAPSIPGLFGSKRGKNPNSLLSQFKNHMKDLTTGANGNFLGLPRPPKSPPKGPPSKKLQKMRDWRAANPGKNWRNYDGGVTHPAFAKGPDTDKHWGTFESSGVYKPKKKSTRL